MVRYDTFLIKLVPKFFIPSPATGAWYIIGLWRFNVFSIWWNSLIHSMLHIHDQCWSSHVSHLACTDFTTLRHINCFHWEMKLCVQRRCIGFAFSLFLFFFVCPSTHSTLELPRRAIIFCPTQSMKRKRRRRSWQVGEQNIYHTRCEFNQWISSLKWKIHFIFFILRHIIRRTFCLRVQCSMKLVNDRPPLSLALSLSVPLSFSLSLPLSLAHSLATHSQ